MGEGQRGFWASAVAGVLTTLAVTLGVEAVLILARLVYLLWEAKP